MISQITTAMLVFASFAGAMPSKRAPVNHDVIVGGPGILRYNPPSIEANVGDTISFTFMQKNHTVTQSTLASPCSPLAGGFDSGFVPVPDSNTAGPFPKANFTVKDTNPIWVYCRQSTHCQSGMVFAVNPGDKLAQFQQNAATSGGSAASPYGGTGSTSTSAAATASSTSTPSGSGSGTDHVVIVGGPGKLLYTPSNITAQPGDTITFQFQQKNHTATQSSFGSPCRPLASTSTSGQVGFDSGFMPVADGVSSGFPTYTVKVNDTAPIWVYCRQANHCGMGMVFSANANEASANTFEAFKAKAMQQSGTGTSSGASPSASTTSGASEGASFGSIKMGGVGLLVAGLLSGLLL
jgi:plastocyanin